jgi:hypothetical protein
MILASHFRRPVPRWADEGAASSVEHSSERAKHQKMLYQFLRTGRGIAFNRMLAMKEYPRDIMPLYAQGHSLATFLIQHGGKRKFVNFLADGMNADQWSAAIKRHYGITDTGTLQNTWLAWVRKGSPQLKSPPSLPAAAAPAEMLASAGQRPRPEPNLIYRIRKRPDSYAPGSVAAARTVSQSGAGSQPNSLPNSGWHPAGTQPLQPGLAAATQHGPVRPPSTPSIRNHVTRPQPFEQVRQIIVQPYPPPRQSVFQHCAPGG